MVHRDRWSRAVDLGVPALLAALGLLEVWLPLESVTGEGSPWVSTLGILLVAALLTQRRVRPGVSLLALAVWPTLGVLAAGDLQVLFLGQLVPLLVLAYSVARHGQGLVQPLGAFAAAAMLLLADLTIESLGNPGEVIFHWGAMVLKWPQLPGAHNLPLYEGVTLALLTAMSLLALLGLRYPVKLLPVLLLEIAWKLLWLSLMALPQALSGDLNTASTEVVVSSSLVILIIAVIPWRYVWTTYATTSGDRWRS